ncbi:hypothetical protein M501DRAFT_1043456 [Patellaria atrata CBS 101060]|uniref:Uncharacterized protein n=1 Tax=Patellaria atrata CBS 101060 TaxID=1346257 RepID=A0A9P4SIK9_9PEZI|nr:hypothetical protein M501DRAFT_1043456 [Patellaria atrata CBS 101060]
MALSANWAGPEKYEDKIELLFSLPAISSATLFLALYFSLNAAIELGHGPIHKNFFRNPEETADARLVFEERLLNAGPEYLLKTLQHDHETAQSLTQNRDLWQHYTLLESAQMYDEEGNPPQKTLISQLRQSFAKSYGCNLHKSMTHILNMACSTDSMLYRLDEEGMGDVISGRVIERAAGKPEEGR